MNGVESSLNKFLLSLWRGLASSSAIILSSSTGSSCCFKGMIFGGGGMSLLVFSNTAHQKKTKKKKSSICSLIKRLHSRWAKQHNKQRIYTRTFTKPSLRTNKTGMSKVLSVGQREVLFTFCTHDCLISDNSGHNFDRVLIFNTQLIVIALEKEFVPFS